MLVHRMVKKSIVEKAVANKVVMLSQVKNFSLIKFSFSTGLSRVRVPITSRRSRPVNRKLDPGLSISYRSPVDCGHALDS